MPRAPEQINLEYTQTCQEIGHRHALILMAEKELTTLKAKVHSLNIEMQKAKELAEAIATRTANEAKKLAGEAIDAAKNLVSSTAPIQSAPETQATPEPTPSEGSAATPAKS